VTDYRDVNRANWDERAAVHAASPEYGLDRFVADPAFLSDTVTFDRPWLGSLDGQRVVHLQCHIGHDTISLARLGAASVVGVDFSPPAIDQARRFVADAGGSDKVRFVQSDVYQALDAVGGDFDLVYTGVGALNWLPDIKRWARSRRRSPTSGTTASARSSRRCSRPA
jgi:SAM-dependent methyltransferase